MMCVRSSMFRLLGILILGSSTAWGQADEPAVGADDWPWWRGPNRNGIACEGLPGTPTSATPTPVPTAGATAKPLPSNGIFSMILAMSGLSLVEAGVGLSLLSDRIKSRGLARRQITKNQPGS